MNSSANITHGSIMASDVRREANEDRLRRREHNRNMRGDNITHVLSLKFSNYRA